MTAFQRTLLGKVACAALLLHSLVASGVSANARGDGAGQEWLSWSASERSAFVNGYITGYLRGSSTACNAADQLFEANEPHSVDDRPSQRCRGRVDIYSRNAAAYTTVLTDFYTKHSEYRGIPSAYLLSLLSDSHYKTADELYQMALKGTIRTNF